MQEPIARTRLRILASNLMRNIPKSLLLLALCSPLVSGCKRAHQLAREVTRSEPDLNPQLQAEITSGHQQALKYPDFTDLQPQVANFYNNRQFDLAWVRNGKPTSQADGMLQEFSNAAKRGLRPEDYDADRWQPMVAGLGSPEGAARFDVALTVDTMRFLNDLHSGRTVPTHFAFGVKGYDSKRLDDATVLSQQIVDAGDLSKAVDAFEPQAEQYKSLKQALAQYQQLATQDQVQPLPEVADKAKPLPLTAGYAGLQSLQQRLAQVGDLTA